MQFCWNVNSLRAMGRALVAAYAMARLPELGDATVIANEESLAGATEIRVAGIKGHVALVETLVVVEQDGWDVNAVGAWHAVLAIVARDGFEPHHLSRSVLQKLEIVVRKGFKGGEGLQVILKMLHESHTAQDGVDPREAACEAERPRGHAHLGLALFEPGYDGSGDFGQSAAEQRLHDYSRDSSLCQLAVEVLGIGVPRVDLLGVFPIEVVELDLDEVPLVLIVA